VPESPVAFHNHELWWIFIAPAAGSLGREIAVVAANRRAVDPERTAAEDRADGRTVAFWMDAAVKGRLEAEMQQISTRERILLRVGLTAAILITLWAFGFIRLGGPTVH
jgi:hypothetical protein